jgi:eukaryotic-like serine/threonine-protein kinase
MTLSSGDQRGPPAPPDGVDAICDAFEAVWLSGQEPRIEDFLPGGEPVHQDVLLRELLLAEWDLRRRHEQHVELETYLERFLESRHCIRDLWRAWKEKPSECSLDDPASGNATALHTAPLGELGKVIGRYKLLEKLGDGGFGTVWVAEQREPIKRRVALKVIKLGMDTRQVIARFEAERQALALMDHANIAKVLDAGTTETGGPYFVMELVRGIPITKYCEQEQLSIQDRLDLFTKVCNPIQHAHQKGIIHRDIKPSNILVTLHDGVPVPKVIDFGIAKATQQELTEKTIYTQLHQFIGTPAYMSPEQAEMSGLDIDTRSDIYSLGVLLYELLTGATPFDAKELMRSGLDEMRKIIREREPLRPSSRLTKELETAKSNESDHAALPSTVGVPHSAIDRDLDWIVMKCLEKDRNRRYETPSSLARDIERYLADESVQACPPSTVYRLRKYARRNKVALAFVTLLLGGLAYLAYSNVAIKRERDAKTMALAQAMTESARAKAVSNLLLEMVGSADAERAKGSQYTVRELLDDFSVGLGHQLADEPAVEADIRTTIGRAYRCLALSEQAQPHLKRAVEIRRRIDLPGNENLAAVLVESAWNLRDLGRLLEAESQLHEALDIYRQQGVTDGPVMYALRALQHTLITAGRYDDAERVTREALAISKRSDEEFSDLASILHRYAEMKITQGHFAEGETLARQAVDMNRRLHGDRHLNTAWALGALVFALQSQQRLAEAESAMREHLAILRSCYGPEHINYRRGVDRLKKILEERGDNAALDQLAREEAHESMHTGSTDYYVRLARHLLTDQSMENARKEEVYRLLEEAKTAIDKELASPLTESNRRATLEFLRDEAEALIGQENADEAVENDNPTPVIPLIPDPKP